MLLSISYVLALYSLSTFAAPTTNDGVPRVKLGKTTLVGRAITASKVEFFGAIPYAEPPLGPLRLRPPVLKTHLNVATFNATNFGKGCLQYPKHLTADEVDEDCMTINVYRPAGISSDAKLPVLFWTHGGGMIQGAGNMFNGSAIVAQSITRGTPIIYVNFNYRLGPLGFPQGQEAINNKALNLGLKDQVTALEWVQQNIGIFGGDKKKVTVFGESAGSIMTSVLFLNSNLEKYARAAIFQSGHSTFKGNFPATHQQSDWDGFVALVPSCADLVATNNTWDCIREAPVAEIFASLVNVETNTAAPFMPVLDGPDGFIPDYPSKLYAKGHFAKLPFIAGTNLDEAPTINSTDQIRASLIAGASPSNNPASLNASVDKILQLYPDVPALGAPFGTGNETFGYSSQYKRLAAISTDAMMLAPRRFWQKAAADFGVKTYGYLFTEPMLADPPALGTTHAVDLTFVYGGLYYKPLEKTTSAHTASSYFIDYWVSFTNGLDPNDGKGVQRPKWEQYTSKNQVLLQINGQNTTTIPDTFRKTQTDFMNSDPAIWFH
ncbi:extracellular triacylglycerol lipase precursor [Laccaria bicolor S238N-H82]|uniref:Carboxylic ester hydrolase n=1 Tax=Laccaria bicolor (strain S238N-H82 / ATCC MYA-4686) TaxID=486041 RepID=B0CPL4_LACBS|nr:extracellular triacylglycerol lipase precursor [Laccaria bicolor S238N-H82]EDR16111.1 extracellular triacylglycerol lipase precursor [Laccaria bicolor S238N-H82]|eukprot:XP_001874319.1 extracellular triacylglycerol lipase precursor [Laccaria bicolor S238N-H82]